MLPMGWNPAPPTTIVVPDDYATIQAAVDAAPRSGETIVVRAGTYNEHVFIDTSNFDDLILEGECGALPVIDPSTGAAIYIENLDDVQSHITVRSFHLTGGMFGVELVHSNSDYNAITTSLDLSRLLIDYCSFGGIQIGERTGTHHCNGDWGAIDEGGLDQPITRINISRCAILDSGFDGMNLWRCTGSILSNVIENCGSEGIHSTDLHDAVVRNNVIIGHDGNQFHLQLPGDVEFSNNLLAGGGAGLILAGATEWQGSDGPEAMIYNNVFFDNKLAGVNVGQVAIRLVRSPCEEEHAFCRAWIRNNVFYGNASDPSSYALQMKGAGQSHYVEFAEYNHFSRNNGRAYDSALISLGPGNQIGSDPCMAAVPRLGVMGMLHDYRELASLAMGFRPLMNSPLIDAGAPAAEYFDASHLAQGGSRNDIGLFDGPAAVISPTLAGATATPCRSILVDWSCSRVLVRDPLFLEPNGDPWQANVVVRNPEGSGQLTVYFVPESRIETEWIGVDHSLSSHNLGSGPLEVLTQ
jgi:hypothetical protein